MGEREQVKLVCESCGARNYKTTKSPAAEIGERLQKKKFCPSCNSHQIHKESK